ncbi:MAG: Transmembrane exosortase (Exosortase_EpsH) [Methanocella sp. PtaU1.Bin125]|nr:MAG: Transmembrane exosortase (Exosortase_EpsH) [Methanocella sp. PtaU1.Bin125]
MDANTILSQAFNALLWASLLALVVAAILPKPWGRYLAAAGWVAFGLHWGLQTPNFYFHENNIMYTVACLIAIPATCYAAYILIRYGRESLMVLTRAAAIAGIFYFPFDVIPALNQWLIETTAGIVFAIITALGQPATRMLSPGGMNDIIDLHNNQVQIILACTAIQSIAIFVGVVSAVRVEWKRWLMAFAVTVPVIYLLNLVRDVFVILAFGNQWFQIMPGTVMSWTGEAAAYTSFFWAHNVLAETGSLIALVAISYVVMTMMPELLAHLMDIISLIKLQNIKRMLRGQEVPVAPIQRVK